MTKPTPTFSTLADLWAEVKDDWPEFVLISTPEGDRIYERGDVTFCQSCGCSEFEEEIRRDGYCEACHYEGEVEYAHQRACLAMVRR